MFHCVLGKGDSTKEAIVGALAEKLPLSAKELFIRVKKNSSQQISYQAVHKSLSELLEAGVIKKESGSYLLSLDWIESEAGFFSNLKAAYSSDFIKSVEGRTLEFGTLYACDLFLIQAMQRILPVLPKKPVLCLHWNHLWIPLFLTRDDYSALRDLAKITKAYSLAKGNAAIDKWCKAFWEQKGAHVQIGADVASTFDLAIVADIIIQVYYSPRIKQKLDEIYSKTANIKDLNLDELFHSVFEKKTTILVKIFKDKQLALELQKSTLSQFANPPRDSSLTNKNY